MLNIMIIVIIIISIITIVIIIMIRCVNYVHYYPRMELELCKSSVAEESLHSYFENLKVCDDHRGVIMMPMPRRRKANLWKWT